MQERPARHRGPPEVVLGSSDPGTRFAAAFVDKQHCHRSLLLVVAQPRSSRSRLPHWLERR
jgi:hypothetical protein